MQPWGALEQETVLGLSGPRPKRLLAPCRFSGKTQEFGPCTRQTGSQTWRPQKLKRRNRRQTAAFSKRKVQNREGVETSPENRRKIAAFLSGTGDARIDSRESFAIDTPPNHSNFRLARITPLSQWVALERGIKNRSVFGTLRSPNTITAQEKWTNGFVRVPAVFCGFLRKSALPKCFVFQDEGTIR